MSAGDYVLIQDEGKTLEAIGRVGDYEYVGEDEEIPSDHAYSRDLVPLLRANPPIDFEDLPKKLTEALPDGSGQSSGITPAQDYSRNGWRELMSELADRNEINILRRKDPILKTNLTESKREIIEQWSELIRNREGDLVDAVEENNERKNKVCRNVEDFVEDNNNRRQNMEIIWENMHSTSMPFWDADTILESNEVETLANVFNQAIENKKYDSEWENKLHGLSSSRLGELFGYLHIENKPIMNSRLDAGLDFFGYEFSDEYHEKIEAFESFKTEYLDTVDYILEDENIPLNIEIDQLFYRIDEAEELVDDNEGKVKEFYQMILDNKGEPKDEYWRNLDIKKRKAEVFLSNPNKENFENWLNSFRWYVSRYRESTVESVFEEMDPEEVATKLEESAKNGEIDPILNIPGFGVSAASEALATLSPSQFAILNKQAAEGFNSLNFDRPNPSTNSPVKYREFLDDVKEITKQYPLREHVDDVPSKATDLEVANYSFYLHDQEEINLRKLVRAGPFSELKELLEQENPQAYLYRQAAAHLVAGKNVVFYGPPGTGKTRAADLLTDALCASKELVTANAEWSNYQVVGGYRPAGESWESNPGFLTSTAARCTETQRRDPPRPSWLIIDELNRANLDEAFGDVFTLLDIDYRTTEPLSYAGEEVYMPLSFRILATMNTYDQAQLFSLGYAFRRRFAFIRVPSLLNDQGPPKSDLSIPSTSPTLNSSGENLVDLIERAAVKSMTLGADGQGVTENDVAVIFPEFSEKEKLQNALTDIQENSELQTDGMTAIETLVYFCTQITEGDVIDIGQALLIDAIKYLIAHQMLFPGDTKRQTLDDAVVAYIVPQFEHFMSELRRSETIAQDNDAKERFERIIQLAKDLSLPKTANVLEEAKETKQLLS
jgi:thermostable 8-oxoguanine DNA glycosylase